MLCSRDDIIQTIAHRFSDDGRWWWDGSRWVATSEVVLPQLPATPFEQSGKLDVARSLMKRRNATSDLLAVDLAIPSGTPLGLIGLALSLPFLLWERKAFRAYRSWTLEQLGFATQHLLGPDEPMIAGETEMRGGRLFGPVTRALAVIVTEAHVLVLRIDSLEGQPRTIALAARAAEVSLQAHGGLVAEPVLVILRGAERWQIRGHPRVFQSGPVIEAWRRAAGARPR